MVLKEATLLPQEFTAKFKVDISDLKKNISDANKEIKLANAEFEAASADSLRAAR